MTADTRQRSERHPAFIIVSPEDIAVCAYKRYVDRGAIHGFDREDWLRAEQELRTRGQTVYGANVPAR